MAGEGSRGRVRVIGAWTFFVLGAVPGVVGIVLLATHLDVAQPTWGFRGALGLWGVTFGVVGLVLALRLPRNPIGWLFCGAGMIAGAGFLGQEIAAATYAAGSTSRLAAWFPIWSWIPLIGLFSAGILLFPSGRPRSLLWRRVLVALAVTTVVYTVVEMFYPWSMDIGYGMEGNPFALGALEGIGGMGETASAIAFQLVTMLSILSLALRRRGADLVLRLQLRWVAYSVIVVAVLVLGNEIFYGLGLLSDDAYRAGSVLLAASIPLVPIAIGVAALRYRLFDIDRIISRTVGYAVLTGVLGAAYAGVVVGLGRLLGPLASGDDLAVAASTLLVAAAFVPARRRIQAVVDRWFNRRRYDARAAIEELAHRLRDQIELDALTGEVRGVVAQTMQPRSVSVWLRPSERP